MMMCGLGSTASASDCTLPVPATGEPLESYQESGWGKVMALNLVAPFQLTRACLGLMDAAALPSDPARVITEHDRVLFVSMHTQDTRCSGEQGVSRTNAARPNIV